WIDDIINDGWNSANTTTWFKTQASINASSSDDNYYVYYGYAGETQAAPAYMSDSMGADTASEVFWYADDFEEHASNTDPDGWTDHGTEDFKVMLQGSEKWFQRTTRVVWNDGSTASSMANIGDAVWSAKLYYHQSGSNAWGGIGVHIANGSVGRTVLIRDQAYYHADEVIGGGSWITNTDIHFPLGTKGRIELVTNGTNLDAYWYNPSGYSPDKVTLFTGYTMLSGTGKLGVYVESPDGVSNFRWVDEDDIIVRQYVSPEPTASPGTEEQPTPALSDWSYRKRIVIDSTKVFANLTDFPLLINLSSDSDLASYAQNDGDDILFTSSTVSWETGTNSDKLDHEIEKFNGSTGELVAWIRIPSLSSTTDTEIYMYYGNSGISNQENPGGVWDTNYMAVWHLNETPNDGVAGHYDSTSNNNTGTPNNFQDGGGGNTDANGKIAGAD
ncbi:MAG: DUF2341 domain-containing protein, partial [Anaerolineales bacterium]|nr:DUF2341 domain-containing protein [Anaerolineales bacterium]